MQCSNDFRIKVTLEPCHKCGFNIALNPKVANGLDKYSCSNERCQSDYIGYGINNKILSTPADYKLRKLRKIAFYYFKVMIIRKICFLSSIQYSANIKLKNTDDTAIVIKNAIKWLSLECSVSTTLCNINYFDKEICQLVIDKCKKYYIKPNVLNLVLTNEYNKIDVQEIFNLFHFQKLHT